MYSQLSAKRELEDAILQAIIEDSDSGRLQETVLVALQHNP